MGVGVVWGLVAIAVLAAQSASAPHHQRHHHHQHQHQHQHHQHQPGPVKGKESVGDAFVLLETQTHKAHGVGHEREGHKGDGKKKDSGFDVDDPATMRNRPDEETRFNTQRFKPEAHAQRKRVTYKETDSTDHVMNSLTLGALQKGNKLPHTDPTKWFPKLDSDDTLSTLLDSAGPVDTDDPLAATAHVQSHSGSTPGSRPASPGFDMGKLMTEMKQNELILAPLVGVGLGMMGSGGPLGFDASGTPEGPDPFNQGKPATDRCYSLEETWLKQCASPPQIYLQEAVAVGEAARAQWDEQDDKDHTVVRQMMWDEARSALKTAARKRAVQREREREGREGREGRGPARTAPPTATATSFIQTAEQMGVPKESAFPAHFSFSAPQQPQQQAPQVPSQPPAFSVRPPPLGVGMDRRWGAGGPGSAGAAALRLGPTPDSDFGPATAPQWQQPGTPEMPGFMSNRPGSVLGAASLPPGQTQPSRPNAPFNFQETIKGMLDDMKYASKVQVGGADEGAAAGYASKAVMGMMGANAGANMAGMADPTQVGVLTRGPDYYDPNGPDGPEPSELQVSGPEKCTRLLDSWLYKCALSPL